MLLLALVSGCVGAPSAPGEIVVTSEGAMVVSEAGDHRTITVRLSVRPTSRVTIPLASSDETELAVSPAAVVFDASNWETPQTITLTGVNDSERDGDQHSELTFGPARSADERFDESVADAIHVTTRDDEPIGVSVGRLSGHVSEEGAAATFSVVLDVQPTAPVEIRVHLSDPSEGTLEAETLRFDAASWNRPQTLRVTGLDDGVDDGPQPLVVLFAVPASEDPMFAALPPPHSVMLVNYEHDAEVGR